MKAIIRGEQRNLSTEIANFLIIIEHIKDRLRHLDRFSTKDIQADPSIFTYSDSDLKAAVREFTNPTKATDYERALKTLPEPIQWMLSKADAAYVRSEDDADDAGMNRTYRCSEAVLRLCLYDYAKEQSGLYHAALTQLSASVFGE